MNFLNLGPLSLDLSYTFGTGEAAHFNFGKWMSELESASQSMTKYLQKACGHVTHFQILGPSYNGWTIDASNLVGLYGQIHRGDY